MARPPGSRICEAERRDFGADATGAAKVGIRRRGRRHQHADGEETKAFGPYKPPQTAVSKELTEQQEKHLNVLIERVTRRTAKSKA